MRGSSSGPGLISQASRQYVPSRNYQEPASKRPAFTQQYTQSAQKAAKYDFSARKYPDPIPPSNLKTKYQPKYQRGSTTESGRYQSEDRGKGRHELSHNERHFQGSYSAIPGREERESIKKELSVQDAGENHNPPSSMIGSRYINTNFEDSTFD